MRPANEEVASNRRTRGSYIGFALAAVLLPALLSLDGCGVPPPSPDSWSLDGGGTASGRNEGGGSSGTNPDGAGAGGNSDGGGLFGVSSDGGARDGALESCTLPGSTRPCCRGMGTQTCTGNEFPTWGPCLDRTGAPATCPVVVDSGCVPNEFGGGCDASVDSPPPPPPPPPKMGCGVGMECIPGSIRYCDDARFPNWSRSDCDSTGHWGACQQSPGVQGCDQTQYDPVACCQPRFLCCQYEVNGPFVDFGGSCSALSCVPLDSGTD
jgi:hypothetical protein